VRAAGNAPGPQEKGQNVKVDKQFLKDANAAGSFVERYLGWSHLNTPMKILVLIVGAYAAIHLAPFMVAIVAILAVFAIPLAVLYGAYRLVRWLIVGNSLGAACPVPNTSEAVPPRSFWRRRRERPITAMIVKTRRERFTELIGSLLMSALVVAVVCGILAVFAHYEHGVPPPERMAWLTLVSLAGAWAILIPAKLWEGVEGDASTRRFVLMVAGIGVGAVACIAADVFMVDLPALPSFFGLDLKDVLEDLLSVGSTGSAFYAVDGRPLVVAHVVCFGSLFLIIRWWRQTDPLRPTRLSLPKLIVCVVLASILAGLWHFPQPWLPLAAGTISVAVQLASPWAGPRRERQEDA